jgi:hypothetical protein
MADLPAPGTKRWVIRRKAEVIAAVRGGLLSLEEACSRYLLTVDEFLSWQSSIDEHGLAGLRTTRIQQYRQQWLLNPAPSSDRPFDQRLIITISRRAIHPLWHRPVLQHIVTGRLRERLESGHDILGSPECSEVMRVAPTENGPQIDHRNSVNRRERTCMNATENAGFA